MGQRQGHSYPGTGHVTTAGDVTYCQPQGEDSLLSLHRGALLGRGNVTARHRHGPQTPLVPVGLQRTRVRNRARRAAVLLLTFTMLSGKPGLQHCRILRRTCATVFLSRYSDTSLAGSAEPSVFLRPRTRRLGTGRPLLLGQDWEERPLTSPRLQ